MLCFNDVYAFENGKDRSCDFRGLGRWTSMTFAGKMNAKITFTMAYCPVNNKARQQSTSSKQRIYINTHMGKHDEKHKDYIPPSADMPRKLFGHNLKAIVIKLKAKGHQVWVMRDFNVDYKELRQWMLDMKGQ